MEDRMIKTYRLITLVFSTVLVILILTAWIREGLFNDWRQYQSEYRDLVTRMVESQPDNGEILKIQKQIRQVALDDLDRVDRCISCHLGIEDPRMSGAVQPHTVHPGDHLKHHPVQQFGCTICHDGQGRALDRLKAFGREKKVHWDYPLLEDPYIQSSCGACHLTLFSDHVELGQTEVFREGQSIFNREGCLGCHKARGVGGTIGPDLTEQGEKTKHEYSFQNIQGEQSISNWMMEHFRDPEMVSPGSAMLAINLPEEELEALVTFTMGLAKPDIPFEYFAIEALQELKGERNVLTGNNIYASFCSACHGKRGEGKDYNDYKTGVPSHSNPGFLQVVSKEYLQFTIHNGRGDRQMTAWHPVYSGIFHMEIDSVIHVIRNRKEIRSSWKVVSSLQGSLERGHEMYNMNCKMCHGEMGKGEIAVAIGNPGFLNLVTNRFIYETILYGRANTAMPSWSELTNQEMANILALLKNWRTNQPFIRIPDLGSGNSREGAVQFHYLCSRCHGEFGEGETGPSILNKDFLKVADDDYLYRIISSGRAHTAMFGWKGQTSGQITIDDKDIIDIIAYIRSTQDTIWDYIYAGSNPGDANQGKNSYLNNCSGCHGKSGSGLLAPALNNQEFLNAATNGYLLATISLGRKGTDMPSWGRGNAEHDKLTGKERQDLVAFIRSWQKIRIKK